jgi:hypothetical protein
MRDLMKTKIAIIATLLLIATTAWASMVLRSGVLRSAVIGEEPVASASSTAKYIEAGGGYYVEAGGNYYIVAE